MNASGIGLLLFRWKIRQNSTETTDTALQALAFFGGLLSAWPPSLQILNLN
jgi:hypothetical protein